VPQAIVDQGCAQCPACKFPFSFVSGELEHHFERCYCRAGWSTSNALSANGRSPVDLTTFQASLSRRASLGSPAAAALSAPPPPPPPPRGRPSGGGGSSAAPRSPPQRGAPPASQADRAAADAAAAAERASSAPHSSLGAFDWALMDGISQDDIFTAPSVGKPNKCPKLFLSKLNAAVEFGLRYTNAHAQGVGSNVGSLLDHFG